MKTQMDAGLNPVGNIFKLWSLDQGFLFFKKEGILSVINGETTKICR